jgi:carboxypeptidase Q
MFTRVKISIFLLFTVMCLLLVPLKAQSIWENDTLALDSIYKDVLMHSQSGEWLKYLCKQVGHRLSGSPAYQSAVEYTSQVLDSIGLDSVYKQTFLVPHWRRGKPSEVRVVESATGSFPITSLALGNTVSTGENGLAAEILMVHSIEELEKLGKEIVKGKIVFYNRRMPDEVINTFHAYGRTVDQRYNGPKLAAELGALACLVRSVTTARDDEPHTGSTYHNPDGGNIPALAIGMASADRLEQAMRLGKVRLWLFCEGHFSTDKLSSNVIGEIRGSEFPDEIIVVSGHLDSWDQGEGAHDDGAGCIHAMDVLHTLRRMGYKPRRTIRCVLFSNEENGLKGGAHYADQAKGRGERHLAALESDRGGFTPRGFTFEGDAPGFIPAFRKVGSWSDLLAPYGLSLEPGGSGADIKPLQPQSTLLVGFVPDSQRYFDFHHAATDVFETVNIRELKMGTAAITSLIFLMDKHGLSAH